MLRRRDWLQLAAIALLTTGVLSALIVAFQGNDLRQHNTAATANPSTSESTSPPEAPALAELQDAVSRQLDDNPITFVPNTANLTQRGQQAAEEITALLTDLPGMVEPPSGPTQQLRCEVGGHVAASSGDEDAAQVLSQERAERVASILVSAGIPPEHVSARGFGDTKPNPDGDDRRVEIVLSTLPSE